MSLLPTREIFYTTIETSLKYWIQPSEQNKFPCNLCQYTKSDPQCGCYKINRRDHFDFHNNSIGSFISIQVSHGFFQFENACQGVVKMHRAMCYTNTNASMDESAREE